MILIALNANGQIVYAKDAISQVDYSCPCCGCRMHVKKSILDNAFFFALDGGHQSSDCRSVEDKNTAVRNPELLSVSTFQNALLGIKGTKVGGGGGGGGGTPKEVLPPCNLPQLQLSGATFLPPDTPIKGGVLSDLLLTYTSFSKFVAPHTSLGFRVMELALDSAFGQTIRFIGWWKQNDQRYRAFFDVRVEEADDFDSLIKKYFAGTSFKEGRLIYDKPMYERALVAGLWTTVDRDECQKTCFYCKDARTPCVGMQRATLVTKNQIFCAEIPKNRK